VGFNVRIAFVTLNAYDILTGGNSGTAGGAQLQQSVIARELVSRGHDVYFVEHDSEIKTKDEVDGIKIVTKPKPQGNFVSRAFQAVSSTFIILKDIHPDVCYFRVLDFEMFPTLLYCKLYDAKFVYGFAHDNEVTTNPNTLTGPIKGSYPYLHLTRKALSAADALITQNQFQHRSASRLFSADTYLIPNGYIDPAVTQTDGPADVPTVLWVSRFRSHKRPEIVLDIADEIPDARFLLIGTKNNEELYESVVDQSQSVDNVEVIGYVPYEQINEYFEACDVFLNTSASEGFPNTFLQAWAHKTPVVSLDVDPNNSLSDTEIGFFADGSVDDLIQQLQTLIDDTDTQHKMGTAAYDYFKNNHSIESVSRRYEDVFEK
jgi:glycosyltransferase involved in cell wall biosynthesis